ncbi:MAG: cation transporter [Candidatus Bathyarchaeota archaeon]|nr:MAG: cation transporter [Candidatus Bathyarchaeota archaeon]
MKALSSDPDLRKKALALVWVGEAWNVFEASIALWTAALASSVALLAFGLDSLIEVFAGAVIIWRFQKGREDEEGEAEKRALRLIGFTFFLLSGFIVFQSIATLLGLFKPPKESLVGILITIASAILMTLLFLYKSQLAKRMGSRALRAEAYQSLVCDLQDLLVFFGLALNSLLGWWWADPVMALALVPLLIREGLEAFEEEIPRAGAERASNLH